VPGNLAADGSPGDEPGIGRAFRLGALIPDPGSARTPEVSVMRFDGLIGSSNPDL